MAHLAARPLNRLKTQSLNPLNRKSTHHSNLPPNRPKLKTLTRYIPQVLNPLRKAAAEAQAPTTATPSREAVERPGLGLGVRLYMY